MSAKFVIPTTFKAIDKFSGTVGKMANNNEKAMSRMNRSFNKASRNAFAVSKKSAMVSAAIIAPLALLANEAVGFEKSMSNVATLIDTNVEDIGKMGDAVLELATTLPVPVEELTASLYDIRSAGISAEQAMATLETSAKLSSAGLSTTEESTNILTSALNAFAAQGLSAEETADILFKTVKNGKTTISQLAQSFGQNTQMIAAAGVTLQDFSAATAALTTTGTPASVAQNELAQVINKLNKPTAEMEKLFSLIGVKTGKELIGTSDNLMDVFQKLSTAAKDNNINLNKAVGSSQAMGAIQSLLGAQGEAYVDTLASMTDGTNALSSAYEKQEGTAASQMQIMKNNLKAVSIELGQALLPLLVDAAKAITPVVKSFGRWVKQNKPLVKTIAKIAAGIGVAAGAISVITFVVGVAAKAMAILNATFLASPIGLVVAGAVALGAAVYGISKAFSSATKAERLNNEVKERAISIASDQLADVKLHFAALRTLKVGTEQYNSTLQKLEQMQPGITEQYKLQSAATRDLDAAEKSLTTSIMERAMQEARAELIKEKVKAAIERQAEDVTAMDNVWAGLFGGGIPAELQKQMDVNTLMGDANTLIEQQVASEQPEASPASLKTATNENIQKQITEQRQNITIDFKNMPAGVTAESSGGDFAMPNVGSTR